MPPPGLAPRLLRLPPILHKQRPRPATSWSKAPRGLFVLPRVNGIFTVPSISPSPPSRQRSDRSTFRAGRNLPDKEFRYLRTVIVTAAVYRGFGSQLAPLPLTFRHWAGLSRYASALCAFAATGVFGKQTPEPGHCGPLTLHRLAASRYTRRPFSRSYGANLPSSLTEVLSPTLVFSTSPPVSVCGTGARPLARGFSRRYGVNPYGSGCPSPYTRLSVIAPVDLPADAPYRLGGPKARNLAPRVPPSLVTVTCGTGIFTRCPSPTALALGLGPPNPQLISMAAEPSGIR